MIFHEKYHYYWLERMLMRWMLMLMAVFAGAATAVQAGVNSHLRGYMMHPMQATFVSFAVGTAASFLICLAIQAPLPSVVGLRGSPWWCWTGGLLGTLFVTTSVMLAPRIGVALMVALNVTGQLLMALVIDHYGLLHMQTTTISPTRAIGALLVIGGMILMAMPSVSR